MEKERVLLLRNVHFVFRFLTILFDDAQLSKAIREKKQKKIPRHS